MGQALEAQRQAQRLREQMEEERQSLAREQQAREATRRALTEAELRLDRERQALDTTRQKLADEATPAAAPARDVGAAVPTAADSAPPEFAAWTPPAEPPVAAPASHPVPAPATTDLAPTEPLPLCGLLAPAGGANEVLGYPERFGLRNFGNAAVTVRYVVTPAGRTDAIAVARTSATIQRYRALFEDAAVEAVRGWTLSFEDSGNGGCMRRQERTSTFQFEY